MPNRLGYRGSDYKAGAGRFHGCLNRATGFQAGRRAMRLLSTASLSPGTLLTRKCIQRLRRAVPATVAADHAPTPLATVLPPAFRALASDTPSYYFRAARSTFVGLRMMGRAQVQPSHRVILAGYSYASYRHRGHSARTGKELPERIVSSNFFLKSRQFIPFRCVLSVQKPSRPLCAGVPAQVSAESKKAATPGDLRAP